MEKNKNRRIFEFHGKSKDREIRGREHNETQKKKRTGGTLRKNTLLRIGRALLWIMLIFFFVRGIIVTFRPDTLTEAQQVISDFKKELITEKKLNNEVLSFAQNFVYEYLTYTTGEEKDYKERLKQYTTTTTNVSDTEIYRGSQQAVYVQAYRMEQLDKEHFDVYVLAEVQYVYYREQEATQESAETRLKVPVLSRNGEMVVDGLPMFVNDNTLLEDYQIQEYSGQAADEQTAAGAGMAVSSFLKAYYEQDETVIDYYLSQEADRSKFIGLDGRYTFDRMQSVRCYQEESMIVCIAEYKISDAVNGAKRWQKVRLNVVRGSDGKYYIQSMSARVIM